MSAEQQQERKPVMDPQREIARKTRRSFLVGAFAAAPGVGAFEWIKTRQREGDEPWPLRAALRTDERLTQAYFRPARLAREFPAGTGEMPIVNGTEGLEDGDFDPAAWKLRVDGLAAGSATVTLDEIKSWPKTEFVTELKCIEGWSKRVEWGGVQFSELV